MIKAGKIYKILEAFEALNKEMPNISYDTFTQLHRQGVIKKLTPRRILGVELLKFIGGSND